MQIKAEQKINKKLLYAHFIDPKENPLISNNVAKINRFFEIFQKIKQHRTLENLCNHYTVDQKLKIFDSYVEFIDELEALMEKFEEFTRKVNIIKQTIKIGKETYPLKTWEKAIGKVASKGSEVTDSIQVRLRLIIRAYGLQVKIPSLSWIRWIENCTQVKYFQKRLCGCF